VRPLSDGPNVEKVAPTVVGGQVTGALVTFTTYLARPAAENTANYIVALLGRKNAFNPVTGAVYNGINRTVQLTFAQPMSATTLYQLRIIGTRPNGLTDRINDPLDGDLLLPRIGTGSNFVETFQGATPVANPQVTTTPTPTKGKKAKKVSAAAVDALLGQGDGIRVRRTAHHRTG
jgi:hypothetical protein